MQTKKVSVIIPVFNSEKYIQECLHSVINQTYTNLEIIAINDGSVDTSEQLIKEISATDHRIIYLEHNGKINRGVSKTRQLGLQYATGEFIAFLDADDYYLPTKIEQQVGIFLKYPEVLLIHSKAEFKRENNVDDSFYNDFSYANQDLLYNFLQKNYLATNPICNSSVLVKREVLMKIDNSFDQLYQFEDWINWILIAQYGSFYYLNQPTCVYRYHSTSSTSAVVKNTLIAKYAKVEMLMILLSRVSNNSIQKNLIIELDKSLNNLYKYYNETSDKFGLIFYIKLIYFKVINKFK